ncbi:MAG: hypothetical protein ACKVU4_06305 [Phycisphaerales bacterium]
MFRPDRERIRGFFEHANTARRQVMWAFRTLWWVVRPWVFWRRITLFVPPRPWRALLWVALLALLIHLASAIPRTVLVLVDPAFSGPRLPSALGGVPGLSTWEVALPQLLNAWTQPMGRTEIWSWGTGGVMWLWQWDPRGYVRAGLVLTAGCLTWPLMFLALGQTMKRCRARQSHVMRAFGYSLAWLPVTLGVIAFGEIAGLMFILAEVLSGARAGTVFEWWEWRDGLAFLTLLMSVLWVPLWWWFAINRGFRLRHGPVVWVVFLVASILVMLNALLVPVVLQSWLRYTV